VTQGSAAQSGVSKYSVIPASLKIWNKIGKGRHKHGLHDSSCRDRKNHDQ
jgi:hypothetical protein